MDLPDRHPNENLLETFYEAVEQSRLDTLATLLAPGITINVAGQSILSGIYRGPDAAVELYQRVIDLMGAGFKFPLHDVLANDDWIVVLPSSAGWRTAALGMDLYRIEQGRIAEIWITEWHTDPRNEGPG